MSRRPWRGEQIYSSTLPSTSALDGLGGQRQTPAALPWENPVPIVYEDGWTPQPVWMVVKNLAPHRNSTTLFQLQQKWNNNIYLLQLGCYPVAVVILHVNKHEIGYY